MELKDQVAPLEMAKRLKELGVKADAQFYWRGDHIWHFNEVTSWPEQEQFHDLIQSGDEAHHIFPAYTASELGEMLPCESGIIGWEVYYNDHIGEWNCVIRDLVKWKGGKVPPPIAYESEGDTMAEAMADALIHCLENKLLTQ